jgi:hypothetical protein
MIYVKRPNDDWDLEDFDYFKGMVNLEKRIEANIKHYGDELSHIDFKWSVEDGEFDQFTIYKA